jgi:WD40 repeat protein
MDAKSVKCKKCEHRFKIADAIKMDPDLEVFVPEIVTASPVEASAPPTSLPPVAGMLDSREDAASVASAKPGPQPPAAGGLFDGIDVPQANPGQPSPYGQDLSQYAANPQVPAAATAGQQPPPPGYPSYAPVNAPTRPPHRSSPMMMPAIFGAVLGSLLMAAVAGGYSYYAVFAPATEAEIAKRDQAKKDASDSVERNRPVVPKDPDRQKGKAAVPLIPDGPDTRLLDATKRDAEEMLKAAEERKKRDAERRAKEAQAAEDRRARAEQAKLDREKRDAERAAEKEAELAEEKRLRLTPEADEQPTENLIMRIQMRRWGASGLALNDDHYLFVLDDRSVYVYDWRTKTEVSSYTFRDHDEDFRRPNSIAINSEGTLLAVGGEKGTIRIFDVDSSGVVQDSPRVIESVHEKDIEQIALSPDGQYLVAVDGRHEPAIWNARTLEPIAKLAPFKKEVKAIHMMPNDGFVRLSDGSERRQVRLENGAVDVAEGFQQNYPHSVAYSPDGTNMVVSSSNLKSFSVGKEEPIAEFKGQGVQWNVAFIDGVRILSCANRQMFEFNILTGELLRTFAIPDAPNIQLIVVSTDGTKAAVSPGSSRQDVFLIDLSE